MMVVVAAIVAGAMVLTVSRGIDGPYQHHFARVIGPSAGATDPAGQVWQARGFGPVVYDFGTSNGESLQPNQVVCLRTLRPPPSPLGLVPLGRDLRRHAEPVNAGRCRGEAPPPL